MRNCETCKYWQWFDDADGEESPYEDDGLGTCTVRPPVYIGVQPGTRPHSPLNWAQPVTIGRGGCGDWKKTNSAIGDIKREIPYGMDPDAQEVI